MRAAEAAWAAEKSFPLLAIHKQFIAWRAHAHKVNTEAHRS
jgi:hypothetical protein